MVIDILGEGVAGASVAVTGAFLFGERGGCGIVTESGGSVSCA